MPVLASGNDVVLIASAAGAVAGKVVGALTDTTAEAICAGSATLVAVTMVVNEVDTVAGAVYNPSDEIMPVVELPPTVLFTAHVTAVVVAPEIIATNCCVPPD